MEMSQDGAHFQRIDTDAQSVFLTGRPYAKEVRFKNESVANQKLVLQAMAREWSKWEEFKAMTVLSQFELEALRIKHPNLRFVGTRWVLTLKYPDYKARLAVQVCQGEPTELRCDSPLGSRGAFFIVIGAADQEHWDICSMDAASAYLQPGGIERLLLLMMPKEKSPPGSLPGEVKVARGNIYSTRDAGRSWYVHFKKTVKDK